MQTIAHVRPDSARLADWTRTFVAAGAEVDATPWTAEAMHDRLRNSRPDVVFALLGTTRARARRSGGGDTRPETYEAVDYGLTALLLHAVREAGIRPRFVYLSSIGVREGTSNPYLRARWRMESELRASGIPFTIARASFISGDDRDEARPGERAAARAADALLGLAALLGATTMRDRYGSMTGRELARALVTAALSRDTENAILDAADLRRYLRATVSAAAPP